MGCTGSSQSKDRFAFSSAFGSALLSHKLRNFETVNGGDKIYRESFETELGALKKIRKPKPWKHPQPLTKTQLLQMREEFWDTAPHYGGRKEIWDALRAAGETDISLAQAIVDSAGVILQSADLTVCYDERGAKYELPKYVLSEPTNLIRES